MAVRARRVNTAALRVLMVLLSQVLICLSGCAMSKQSRLEVDGSHWVPFVFSEGPMLVTIRIPNGFQILPVPGPLPAANYDQRAERYLLIKGYDFGSPGSFDLAEFMILLHLTKLKSPLDPASFNKHALTEAISALTLKPMRLDDDPLAGPEIIDGRSWLHYHYPAQELFAAMLDDTNVLILTGAYGDRILKDAAWLESRKQLLRLVRDRLSISRN